MPENPEFGPVNFCRNHSPLARARFISIALGRPQGVHTRLDRWLHRNARDLRGERRRSLPDG